MTVADFLLGASAVLTALVAGLFYAWSVSITLGLKRVSDTEYISVMQSTNREIQNAFFFSVFFGAQIVLPVTTYFYYGHVHRFWLLLAATLFYSVGVMGVTIFGNVPMNNRLDRFELEKAGETEMARERKQYEGGWNILNNLRTVSSLVAIVLVVIACLCRD